MSFSKINNNFNIAKLHNLPSGNFRSFKATDDSDNLPNDLTEDNNVKKLSDDEIYALSAYLPDKKMSKVAANTMKTLLVTVPVLDTAATALVKKGNLATKIKAGAKSAGKWGAVLAAGAAVAGMKNLVNSHVEPLDKLDKKHPVLSTIIDFSAIYTAFDMVNKGACAFKDVVKSKFPDFVQKADRHVYQPVKKVLNNSFVNKKLVMPAEKFVEKRPYLGIANNISAFVLMPAMIVASYIRYSKELTNRNLQVQNNINILTAVNNAIAEDSQE